MKDYKIITYLSFNGDCEDAVKAYIDAFGGRILFMSRWDEKNYEKECQIGKVMHVEFVLGETRMAAGDTCEGDIPTRSMKLMIHMDTEEEARKSIAILANNGKIISELKAHPAPDDGGMGSIILDKYGYTWIITCPNTRKED